MWLGGRSKRIENVCEILLARFHYARDFLPASFQSSHWDWSRVGCPKSLCLLCCDFPDWQGRKMLHPWVSLLNLMDNFIWNAALSWFRFVEEHKPNYLQSTEFTSWTSERHRMKYGGTTQRYCHQLLVRFVSWGTLTSNRKLPSVEIHRKISGWKLSTLLILVQRWWARKTWIGSYGAHLSRIDEMRLDTFQWLQSNRAVPEIIQRCVWMLRKTACWSSVFSFFKWELSF